MLAVSFANTKYTRDESCGRYKTRKIEEETPQ
jgi:hypothetical protein